MNASGQRPAPDLPDFAQLVDLASRRLGGGVIAANDELFAERENLIKPEAPVYSTYTFGHKGQIYDGWETRRRREPGHDWAIIRLGLPGVVRGVVVDTSHFVGNYPPEISVEATTADGYPSPEELADADWFPLVPRSGVSGDARNPFPVRVERYVTHVRLRLYPDGGVARLRVHGEPVPDPRLLPSHGVDLAALENGGEVVDCSNMFYSSPRNLIFPGLARVMGEGWETARRRDTGNDFVEFRLAGPGVIRLAELDTSYFVGNSPGWAALRGRDARADDTWVELLGRRPLQPDTRHRIRLANPREVTHVRLDIYPDGGMARVRLWGELAEEGRHRLVARWFDLLPDRQARRVLVEDCGLGADQAAAVVASRPVTGQDKLPDALRALPHC
jgi:allantoicase